MRAKCLASPGYRWSLRFRDDDRNVVATDQRKTSARAGPEFACWWRSVIEYIFGAPAVCRSAACTPQGRSRALSKDCAT